MAPTTGPELVELVRKSRLVDATRLDAFLGRPESLAALGQGPKPLAGLLIQKGLLTQFQAQQMLLGKWKGFNFGKYRVLEQVGRSVNSSVFLCEHLLMCRRVAIKVLPMVEAQNPTALARFQREARAAAALDHPNIVHTYDSGQEGDLHYLVMEYVDGYNLQEIVERHGPMDVLRAAHYIRQAALGLQHVHEAGLIHRDIKPANLLLDRRGVVRVLDLGLARFYHDHQDMLTRKCEGNSILGTADYLSPEQARDSHEVDIRTDVYSLGATFYFLLTGHPPFEGKSVAQKLIHHQLKAPTPVREHRPEVPGGLAAVVATMMAKEPAQRYQNLTALVKALAPWTRTPIAAPPAEEMPQLCRAAQGVGPFGGDSKRVVVAAAKAATANGAGGETSAVGLKEKPSAGGAEPCNSTAITRVTRRGKGGPPNEAAATGDTVPVLARADTDRQLARNVAAEAPPPPEPEPRRRLLPWVLAAGIALSAGLGWVLMKLIF
jgi:hypothetical protein